MTPFSPLFDFAGKSLDLSVSHVMGILNITPDSFSDGGELMNDSGHVVLSKVMQRAEAMVNAGAALLDVGGESTRPGAAIIASDQEINRVMPVIEAIRKDLDIIISVDTSNPDLIRLCRDAGVGLINDVRALSRDGALAAVAQSGLPVCLMHMQGTPQDMQDNPGYQDVVDEVGAFLAARVQACNTVGISNDRIILDPGFGFGKTLAHNLELLGRLKEFQRLELPLLIGVSRKRMIGLITGRREKDRVQGSVAAAVIGVMNGGRIVRTHDVSETVDALNICNEVLRVQQAK
jgi:dihydropteroate synthase